MIGVMAAREMSGLEYLQAMQRDELPWPPIGHLMDFQAHEVEEGRVVFKFTAAEYHYNPIGTVHGGVACTLLDSVMGCAVHSQLPKGVGYTTLELKVNYLRPMTVQTGEVFCEGKVLYLGGRQAIAEGQIKDGAGKVYAHSTTTCLIFR